MDAEISQDLAMLYDVINDNIDKLIKKRDACIGADKYPYRYACRKLENCIGQIRLAQDKINYNNVDFKLDETKTAV